MLGDFGSARSAPAVLRRMQEFMQRAIERNEELFGSGVLVTVAELPCREPDCPPLDTVVSVLSSRTPLCFRVRKAAREVLDAELLAELMGRAELARASADTLDGRPAPSPAPPETQALTEDEHSTEVTPELLEETVRRAVAQTPAIDVHTHLFPPSHGALCSWGIDAMLTYHYLVSEFFMVAPAEVTHASFFQTPVSAQADLVWLHLFVRRTPISEAQIGVLTTLSRLGLGELMRARSLAPIRAWFAAQDLRAHCARVLEVANVEYVVCTNIPFDALETSKFVSASCCVDERTAEFDDAGAKVEPDAGEAARFKTALRVDALLAGDWPTIAASLRQRGLPETLAGARAFLTAWARRYRAVYLMASSPAAFAYGAADDVCEPGAFTCTQLVDEVLVPVARALGLPLALKLGCERGVAPELAPYGGGDGVLVADTAPLKRLCARNPSVKFLCTFLSRVNQHEACVLAQKFRNLHLYGCWWYCNNPSIIAELTLQRLEMLGTAFTAQHSDCRVLEQLVYKWEHSRRVIATALIQQYRHLLRSGWRLQRADVLRDARSLLGGSYLDFIHR